MNKSTTHELWTVLAARFDAANRATSRPECHHAILQARVAAAELCPRCPLHSGDLNMMDMVEKGDIVVMRYTVTPHDADTED